MRSVIGSHFLSSAEAGSQTNDALGPQLKLWATVLTQASPAKLPLSELRDLGVARGFAARLRDHETAQPRQRTADRIFCPRLRTAYPR
jgi:hypothetical protein